MKKIIACLCALLVLFTLGACSADKKGDTNSDESISVEENKNEDKQTEVQQSTSLTETQAAYLYNRAFVEASTWFNFSNPYWDREDEYMSEKGFNFAIRHESINSIASLKEHLTKYFTQNLVDTIVPELYSEKDGKLYHFSPEAGDRLPDYRLNNTKAVITSEEDGQIECDITVDMFFDDGPDSPYTRQEYETNTVIFVFENGNWVIGNHFKHNLYPPYSWDGTSPLGNTSDVSGSSSAAETTEELREFVPNS